MAREVPDTARYGCLVTAHGRVLSFSEKGAAGPGLINAGCYVFPTQILDGFARGQPFSLEVDFLANSVQRSVFECFITHGHFIDIGVPADYMRAQRELAKIVL